MWYPQVSFRNGEVSPRLDGLSNPEVYEASCRKVEGAIVSSSGTIEKRGGTRFVDDTAFSTDSETNFESTAIKLVPFEVKADTYVLSFEVMTNSTRTWGIIRAVKNDVFHTSAGVDAYAGTDVWKTYTKSNLPFKASGVSGGSADDDYLPPGGDNTFSGLFGWHHFTAAQLPEVTYFQHESVLTICHPDAPPMQVFLDGEFLNTRLYECFGRSPEVDRRGDRFTMTVTATAGTGEYTVETTRSWFDERDIGCIYRIGSLQAESTSTVTPTGDTPAAIADESDDRGGYFAMVTEVESDKKVTVIGISDLTVGGRTYVPETSDPYDWDGPWVRDTDLFEYSHTKPGRKITAWSLLASGTTTFEDAPKSEITIQPYRSPIGGSDPSTSNLLSGSDIGCIVGNRQSSAGSNIDRECYAIITGETTVMAGFVDFLTAQVINGDQVPTADVPGWTVADDEDRLPLSAAHPAPPGSFLNLDLALQDQHIYRLKSKVRDMKNAHVISFNREYNTEDTSGDPYYTVPVVGDLIDVNIGNSGDIDVSDAIPDGHGQPLFDTEVHGDSTSPTSFGSSTNAIGGTIHVNGGVLASTWDAFGTTPSNPFMVIKPPRSLSVTNKYSLGWSHGVGFPGCGVSHQGRVLFSGFKNARQVVVGSHPDRPDDFTLGGTASDGFHFIVNDLRGSLVRWLASGKDLLMGTSTGEFSVTGSPLSPLSVGVDRQSAYGSASIRPAIVANLLLFVQKDKKTLRAMKFNFDNQRYVSKNIAQEHSHFFASATIEEMMVWEGLEDPVVLVRLSDGEVLSCRVNTTDGFYGWSRMKLPICSSICPARNYTAGVSSVATAVDSFYAAIDDTDKYRLARFEDNLYIDEAVTPATTTHTADPTNTLAINLPAGVVHLNGVTVSVILDGLYRDEWLCTDGVITVTGEVADTAAASIRVGKKISMLVQPRVPESVGTPRTPSTLGRNKNVSSVVANVNGSRGVKVNGYEIDNNFSTDSGTVLPALSQGWFEVPVAGLYGLQPLVEVSTDRPYPAEIVGISIDMSTEG